MITQFGYGMEGDTILESSSNHAICVSPEDGMTSRYGASSVNWYLLLFVVIVTLFAIHWGFVRPTSLQLTKLRRYVTSLEQSIADLNGQRENAATTASLLNELVRQGRATSDAAIALSEMRDLHRQLVHEADQLRSARQALEKLTELRTDVARHVSLIEATRRTLTSIQGLHQQVCRTAIEAEEAQLAVEQLDLLRDGLVESIQKMEEADPLLASVDALHRRLASAADRTRQARVVSDNLLAIEEDLLNRGGDAEVAQLALNDLIDLRHQVEAQATKIEKADTTLDQLLQLQDSVLAQSDSVVDAIETLELSVDMQKQMQRARHTFDGIRRMMTEVVIMEPMVRQAMQSLQPLTALGNLRRLSVAELRVAANIVSHRRHALVTEILDAEEPNEVVADAHRSSINN